MARGNTYGLLTVADRPNPVVGDYVLPMTPMTET